MAGGDLLFVNSHAEGDNVSRDKTVRDARSFVMRKIRSEKMWSSKTNKPINRRKTRHLRNQDPSRSVERVVPVIVNDPGSCTHIYPSGESATASRSRGRRVTGRTALSAGTRRCKLCGEIVDDSKSGNQVLVDPAITDHAGLGFPSPSPPPLDGLIDPFTSTAVPLDQKTHGLLAYFMRGIVPHLTPMAIGSQQQEAIIRHWLQPSLHHAAFMHSLLCLVALQLCIMQPSRSAHDVVYHKIHAIAAVQENLSNPDTAITDENIAAVFNLLCVEENMFLPIWRAQTRKISKLEPDHTQRMVQMEGLKRMIQMRGGVRSLTKIRGLQVLLMRHTAVQAVTAFDIAYTLPEDTIRSIYGYPESSQFWTSPQPIAAACEVFDIDQTLLDIVKTIGCLIQDTILWYNDNSVYGWDILDVQSIFAAVIDRVLLWYLENEFVLRQVEGVISLSMIGFMSFICRGRGNVRGPLRNNMLSRLKRHMTSPEVLSHLKGTKLLVWLSTIAAAGSIDADENDFFMCVLSKSFADQRPKITSLNGLKMTLKSLLWLHRPMDAYVGELWSSYERWTKKSASDVESHPCAVETVTGVSQSSVQAFLNPYANGHPLTHVTVSGSAYGL